MKQEIKKFAERVESLLIRKYHSSSRIGINFGKKYAKLIHTSFETTQTVFCFVVIETGDILKPANWKTPTKGLRGNINDEHKGMSWVTPTGIRSKR